MTVEKQLDVLNNGAQQLVAGKVLDDGMGFLTLSLAGLLVTMHREHMKGLNELREEIARGALPVRTPTLTR